MEVFIDPDSGFCGGVIRAIRLAEEGTNLGVELYCLGEIVHNEAEVNRLLSRGIKFISHEELKDLKNVRVMIRAHGEPPETYELAKQNNLELIDATCKVVQSLQQKIRIASDEMINVDGQIVIFGKKKHPEVIGLVGQSKAKVVVLSNADEIDKIDFKRPIRLFSQTTKNTHEFEKLRSLIQNKIAIQDQKNLDFYDATNTVCRQVSNREQKLILLANEYDVLIFVGGKNSSNARFLFGICEKHNPNSYFVSDEEEIEEDWFMGKDKVGIAGATSTPQWLMEKVAQKIKSL
jgi:4-hydroxy-3-methylbut-2-en-1-yl diphosphate reductase